MAVIKIYLSEDGENYVSKFPNSTKEFSSICEKGHYQIPLGWSFGGTHKTNTFQCRLSGTPYYINEFEKYKHIKVTKNGTIVFLGSNPNFKKTIEKADYYEVTATYEDYSRKFSDVLFSSDLTWEKTILTSDGWTVCNPSDTSHSLVHYLFSCLNTDNTFTLHCTYTDSTPVSYAYFKYNNKVMDAWDKCLKQNALAYYVTNRDMYVFDILEQISGTATTIPNIESEATINEKPYVDHTLPAIRRPTLIQNYPSGRETRVYDSGTIDLASASLINYDTTYEGTMQAGSVKVGDNQEVKAMRNLTWHFSGSHSNNPKFRVQNGAPYETTMWGVVKVVKTPYTDKYTSSASGSAYDETLKFILSNDNLIAHRQGTVWMTANVDVLDYNALTKPFDETEWNGKEEKCEFIYASTNADVPEQNAVRYLNALRYASKMEAKKYNFYSDLDLALNTICVIQNVTTAEEIANHEYIRITDKVDNLDDFGGYTYTGVPYVSEQVVADNFFNPVVFDEKSISKAFDFYANRTNVLIAKNGEIAPNQTITYTISLREYYAVPTIMVEGVAQALVRRTVTDTSVTPNVTEYLNIWDCAFNPATLTTVNGNIRAVANLDGEIRQIDIGIIIASVQDVAVQYRLSDSKDEVTGDYQWSETKPTGSGYIWRRQKYTYSDGSVLYSEPVYLLVSSDVVLTEYRLENLGSNVISHNAERTGQQTLTMRAVIVGVTSPLPVIESVSIPRLWAYSSGGNRETVISSLYTMMDNETPFTPAFSGANDWVRTDTEVYTSATGSIAVGYEFSDGSYATAILAISNIGQTDITGTITSIYEYSLIGIDDRDPEVQAIAYIPYKTNAGDSISFSLFDVSTGSKVEKGLVTFSIIEETRSPKSFGTSESIISHTYYTIDGEAFYYINGDSYVYLTFSTDSTSGEVTKQAQIYTFQDGVWASISSLTDSTEIHRIHLQSIEDIFEIYSGENHVSVNGYDWFKQVIAEHISAVYYFVGGAIYGYGQNGAVDMTQPPGQRAQGDAFIIDKNGIIEISSGYARDLHVRNTLDLYADNGTDAGAEILHPALTTVPESRATDTVGVTVNTQAVAWTGDNLLSALSNVTKNSINTSSGTFGNKNLAYYVYADNLATQLQAQIVVDKKSLYPYQDSFSIPRYVKGTLSINISGNTSSASRTSTSGFNDGTITIKKNNVTVFSQTGGDYSYTASLTGNDTITVSDSFAHGSHNWVYPKVSYTIPALTLAQYVTSTGFWLEYSDGSMEQIISSDTYTDRLQMSSPVSFDSDNYLTHRDCSALINYTSYTEGGITYNLDINVPYTFKGTNLIINGASVSSGSFSRISNSSVRIQFGGNAITVSSGSYYNIYGTIAVQKTERGVEMMGNYPRTTMFYNTGNPEKVWLNGYIANVVGASKREIKEEISRYERKALDVLNKTEIVRFKYKADPKHIPHIGFIADDTDSDLSGENHDSMMVNNCLAVLIKAVQELSEEVNHIKKLL